MTLRPQITCIPLALLTGLLGLTAGGCPMVPALPPEFEVAISATERRAAPIHSGPPNLANSTWEGARVGVPGEEEPPPPAEAPPGPYGGLLSGGVLPRPPVGEPMFRIHFGDDGRALRVSENRYVLPDIYGSEIPIGVGWIPSTLPGFEFQGVSYGLAVGNRIGLAILAQVRSGPTFVGEAIVYAWGTVNGNQIDGQFGYLIDLTEGAGRVLFDMTADQYPIRLTRVE
ncbi:MAG: hypothetical protein AB1716_16710 [Planctomycetota bacterium]